MGKKKKFTDMLSQDDDEDLILMPDYYVILEGPVLFYGQLLEVLHGLPCTF